MTDAIPIDAICDAKAATDFKIGDQKTVGMVKKWSITNGGKDLKADWPVKDPSSPDADLEAVSVLDFAGWSLQPGQPVKFRGRVSPENQGMLMDTINARTGGAEMELDFEVWRYDRKAGKYYKHFHSDGKAVKFTLTKGAPKTVSPDPATDIQKPDNYEYELSLTACSEGSPQTVTVAYYTGGNNSWPIGTATT